MAEQRYAAPLFAGLALVLFAPGLVFLAAPLLLGVPHLVSDVRVLLLRRGVPRRLVLVSALACAALVAVRALEVARVTGSLALVEVLIGGAWVLFAAATRPARDDAERREETPWWHPTRRLSPRALALLASAAAFGAACAQPASARAVLVVGHNVVALVLWALLSRASLQRVLAVLATVLTAAVALFFVGARFALPQMPGVDLAAAGAALLPGAQASVAEGALASLLFLQVVHYAVWLRWMPRLPLGVPARRAALAVTALGLGVVLCAASVDARVTRDVYLSLATFHAWLELALGAFLVVRGELRRPRVMTA